MCRQRSPGRYAWLGTMDWDGRMDHDRPNGCGMLLSRCRPWVINICLPASFPGKPSCLHTSPRGRGMRGSRGFKTLVGGVARRLREFGTRADWSRRQDAGAGRCWDISGILHLRVADRGALGDQWVSVGVGDRSCLGDLVRVQLEENGICVPKCCGVFLSPCGKCVSWGDGIG